MGSLRLFLVLLLCFSLHTKGATSEQPDWQKLHGLGQVESFRLEYKQGDKVQPYYIFVRLPPVNEQKPESAKTKRYPTLYLLDGGTNFPLMAAYYQFLHFMQDAPPMLIVGISYGTSDWHQGNNRGHDFTLPAKTRDHWGGAKAFEKWLAQKLIPKIENDYPADPNNRILFGQSLGGQFALYTAMYGNSPFNGVIASNPALHANLDDFLKPIKQGSGRPKAFISLAELDDKRFREPALKWQKHWQDKAPKWQRNVHQLAEHNHLSANPDALRNGLIWLFASQD